MNEKRCIKLPKNKITIRLFEYDNKEFGIALDAMIDKKTQRMGFAGGKDISGPGELQSAMRDIIKAFLKGEIKAKEMYRRDRG